LFKWISTCTAGKSDTGLKLSLLSPAPDAPLITNHTNIAPEKSHGPRVKLTWSAPRLANGIIRGYTLFYGHDKDTRKEIIGIDTLSYSVDVLGGLTYQFYVRAVTVRPGENATLTVNVPEYGKLHVSSFLNANLNILFCFILPSLVSLIYIYEQFLYLSVTMQLIL